MYDVVADCPSPLVTVTVTVPDPAGAVTTTWLETRLVTVAPAPPNVTAAPVRNPLPAIVTLFPPASRPLAGAIPEIVGAGL